MGGWVWPNAYVCLHSGWVGLVKCLRNQKSNTEKWISWKWWKFDQSVSKNKYNLLFLFFFFFRDKTGHILKFMYLPSKQQKKIERVGGFSKILRNYKSGSWQMLTSTYKVGGWGEKRPKTCLRNIWMVPIVLNNFIK